MFGSPQQFDTLRNGLRANLYHSPLPTPHIADPTNAGDDRVLKILNKGGLGDGLGTRQRRPSRQPDVPSLELSATSQDCIPAFRAHFAEMEALPETLPGSYPVLDYHGIATPIRQDVWLYFLVHSQELGSHLHLAGQHRLLCLSHLLGKRYASCRAGHLSC